MLNRVTSRQIINYHSPDYGVIFIHGYGFSCYEMDAHAKTPRSRIMVTLKVYTAIKTMVGSVVHPLTTIPATSPIGGSPSTYCVPCLYGDSLTGIFSRVEEIA